MASPLPDHAYVGPCRIEGDTCSSTTGAVVINPNKTQKHNLHEIRQLTKLRLMSTIGRGIRIRKGVNKLFSKACTLRVKRRHGDVYVGERRKVYEKKAVVKCDGTHLFLSLHQPHRVEIALHHRENAKLHRRLCLFQ